MRIEIEEKEITSIMSLLAICVFIFALIVIARELIISEDTIKMHKLSLEQSEKMAQTKGRK